MGRQKVRPEDRQRAARACTWCKASKKRCDAQQPCLQCVRRDRASTCSYSHAVPYRRESISQRPLEPRYARMGSVGSSATDATDRATAVEYGVGIDAGIGLADNGRDCGHNLSLGLEDPRSPGESLPSSTDLTRSRMLLSAKGEKMYIGETASISFLQFLRKLVEKHVGPSPFTDNDRKNFMLEAEIQTETLDDLNEDFETKQALIEKYFEVSSALLNLYTKEELYAMLLEQEGLAGSSSTKISNSDKYTGLYLAIAIGGQCRGSPTDLQYASKYFSRGQQLSFQGMLMDPNLEMIRSFLLMAFYMLGACRRNAAFMYIGVASKAASALGLHMASQYGSLQKDELRARLRTWQSLRVLDQLVSSILGRPSSSPLTRPDDLHLRKFETEIRDSSDSAINATFAACSLIEDIVQKLSKRNSMDLGSAEYLLEQLRDWSHRLPGELRRFPREGDTISFNSADRELLIGNVHIACVYYFAVILVTRHFLVRYLFSYLRKRNEPFEAAPATSAVDERTAQLAQVCVDSAVFLSQTCHKAAISGLLLKNMCIMKAWLFSAGLTLGFSLFVQGNRYDTKDAYNNAREVLKQLGELSPQAQHYHEILTSFSESITLYQQHLVYERRRTNNQYVDQILALDAKEKTPQPLGAQSVSSGDCLGGIGSSSNPISSVGTPRGDTNIDFRFLFDGCDLSIPDGFIFGAEPFGMFFESME